MVKKVDNEGSGRTAEGVDRQDGARQAWRWNLGTRKWATRRRVERRPPEKSGKWKAVFQRGFLRHVDRPRAP